jgi:hypothetical protein
LNSALSLYQQLIRPILLYLLDLCVGRAWFSGSFGAGFFLFEGGL